MDKYVAIEENGKIEIHARGIVTDHATLCGFDGDDPTEGQFPRELPEKAKIDCVYCQMIIKHVKKYTKRDFKI